MDAVNKILTQVPQQIRENGTFRERAKKVWEILGAHRNGGQKEVAGRLAEAWAFYGRQPKLNTDIPREAATKFQKCLTGELSMDLDLYREFLIALPEEYRQALEAMNHIGGGSSGVTADLCVRSAIQANREADNTNDRMITDLLISGWEHRSAEELRVIAGRLRDEGGRIDDLVAAIENHMKVRETA